MTSFVSNKFFLPCDALLVVYYLNHTNWRNCWVAESVCGSSMGRGGGCTSTPARGSGECCELPQRDTGWTAADGVGRVLNSNLELNHDMTSFVGLPMTWYVTHESRWTPSTVDYFTFFYVRFLWLAVEAIRQLHGARHCLHPVCLKSWLHLRCNNTTVWNAERAPFKSDATTGGIKAWLYWPTSLSYLASNSYFYISMKSMQRSRAGNKRTKIVLTLAFIMNDELQRVVQCSCGCELVAEIGSCISTVYTVRRMLYSIISRELVHEIPEAPGSLREYRWWNGKWLPIL